MITNYRKLAKQRLQNLKSLVFVIRIQNNYFADSQNQLFERVVILIAGQLQKSSTEEIWNFFTELAALLAMAFSQFTKFSKQCFQSRIKTVCSYDRLDKSTSLEIISLCNCSKNITDHCSYCWSFSGVNTERELILARVGVFSDKETSAQNRN